MPTPRQHGGAPLQHFPLNLPGFKGLNKQSQGALLGPEWATRLENTVIDINNRIAARKGWEDLTTTAHSADLVQLHEYVRISGVREIHATDDSNAMVRSTDDGATWTTVTNTATVTDPNMQIVNFNEVMMGFQNDDTPILYNNATNNWSDSAATGVPTGNIALSAFGRIWAVDTDKVTIKYCALLNEADWNGVDTGSIDMTNVWPSTDTITALAAFNSRLIVFGSRNIVIWEDGANTALGVDPTKLYVVDTIPGIGCIARDTVQNVAGDIWFLSDAGLHSLSRVIQEKSNPLNNLSLNIQDYLNIIVKATTASNIRSAYSPDDRFYLLSLSSGAGSAESGLSVVFDTRGVLETGAARVGGIWNTLVPSALVVRDNGNLIMCLHSKQGKVGIYRTYLDDTSTYGLEYESGWTDLSGGSDVGQYLKIIKRISGLFYTQRTTTLSLKWAFDFESSFSIRALSLPGGSAPSEYGVSEYGADEYGGGVNITDQQAAGSGTGEYLKIGASATIDNSEFAMQQLAVYGKLGRIK